ncbi:TonB dependent receptor [compost metagenome]
MSMIWAGESGAQYYWNDHGYNNNVLISGNQVTTRIADDHYFYNPNSPDDPRTNQNGYFPRLKYGTSAENINNQSSDYWLYESNFFKLRNLQIGYTFDKKLTEKFKVRNLRIFFSGENLLMFTNFPGLDPEVGAGAEYPTMKQYAFGLNFGF